MGLVLSLFSAKVDISSRSGRLPAPVLWSETLMTGPSLDQRSVHREMFIRHVRLGSFQHPLKKRLRDLFVQQTLSILAVHRVIPDRLVHPLERLIEKSAYISNWCYPVPRLP